MSKLLYKSFLGKIYDDKILLKKQKLAIVNIKDFDLHYYVDKKKNLLFFTVSVIGILLNFFFVKTKISYTVFFFSFFSLFFLSMFYKEKKYYIKIILFDGEEIYIKLKNIKEKDESKVFINKFWRYYKSNNLDKKLTNEFIKDELFA